MSETLYTGDELADATGGTWQGSDSRIPIYGLSIDTRTLKAGDMYVALKGDRFDGHSFVDAAVKAGAAASLVRKDKLSSLPQGAYLAVDDVEEALRAIASLRRSQSAAKIIAVTGSVGKTGTKEMLHLALEASGKTHASVASFNNHWGVPLSLARMPRDCSFAVFEIGMNHAGEITPLVALVRPHAAIVTTIAPVHLEFFKDLDDIADAKAEIFTGLEPQGTAIINADIAQSERLVDAAKKSGAQIVLFGEHDNADVRLKQIVLQTVESHLDVCVMGTEMTYRIGAPGVHIAQNSLAVIAACKILGADLALAGLALADMRAGKGRGARYKLTCGTGDFVLIDESYNANPTSMRAALALLGETPTGRGGRRIAVLGDMLELGEQSPDLHRGLADALQGKKIDTVFLAGPAMKNLWDALPTSLRGQHHPQSAAIEQKLIESISPGDVVMIKGSNGSRMGPVVESLLTRFSQAE